MGLRLPPDLRGRSKNLETRNLTERFVHGVARSCTVSPGQPVHQPRGGRGTGSGAQEGQGPVPEALLPLWHISLNGNHPEDVKLDPAGWMPWLHPPWRFDHLTLEFGRFGLSRRPSRGPKFGFNGVIPASVRDRCAAVPPLCSAGPTVPSSGSPSVLNRWTVYSVSDEKSHILFCSFCPHGFW